MRTDVLWDIRCPAIRFFCLCIHKTSNFLRFRAKGSLHSWDVFIHSHSVEGCHVPPPLIGLHVKTVTAVWQPNFPSYPPSAFRLAPHECRPALPSGLHTIEAFSSGESMGWKGEAMAWAEIDQLSLLRCSERSSVESAAARFCGTSSQGGRAIIKNSFRHSRSLCCSRPRKLLRHGTLKAMSAS